MSEGPACSKHHPRTRGRALRWCCCTPVCAFCLSGFTALLQAGFQGQLPPVRYFQPRSGSRWTSQPLTLSLPPQAPLPPNPPKGPGHAGLYAHCLPSHPLYQSATSEATCSQRLLGSSTSFRVAASRWNQVLSDLDRPLAEPPRAHGDRPALYTVPGRARVCIYDTN